MRNDVTTHPSILVLLLVALISASSRTEAQLPLSETPSRELCVEFSLDSNVGLSGEVEADAEAEGRVGAEAYGNGAMAKLKAIPGLKLSAGVSGDVVVTYEVCWDDLTGPLPALKEYVNENFPQLGMGQSDLLTAVKKVLLLNSSTKVAMDGTNENMRTLAGVLPLPQAFRQTLEDSAQIVSQFNTNVEKDCATAGYESLFPGICGDVQTAPTLQDMLTMQTELHATKAKLDDTKRELDKVKTLSTASYCWSCNSKRQQKNTWCSDFKKYCT